MLRPTLQCFGQHQATEIWQCSGKRYIKYVVEYTMCNASRSTSGTQHMYRLVFHHAPFTPTMPPQSDQTVTTVLIKGMPLFLSLSTAERQEDYRSL
jgi:hypothetical protein